jgi:hypothetical protein
VEENMRRFLVLFVIIVFVSSLVLAGNDNPGSNAGNKGVLFQFNGLNALGAGAYNGGFGAKLFLSDLMAVRGVICLGLSSSKLPASPANGQFGADGSNSSNTFGLGGGIELHLTKNRISPYFGGGIMLTTKSTEEKTIGYGATAAAAANDQIVTKNVGGYAQFSFGGIIGVEYYLTDGVSLSAEYLIGVALTSNKDITRTSGGQTTTTPQGSSSDIGITNGGTLTLAVYF